MMTMKLFYYDEITPADYEPPGFKASNDDAFVFAEDSTNIAIGEVSTPFHSVKMRVKTGSKQFDMLEDPIEEIVEAAEESLSISNAGLDCETRGANQSIQEVACEKTASSANRITGENEQVMNNINAAYSDAVVSSDKPDNNEDFHVRCPCGCNEDDGLMVMCSNCSFWQHGVCFLIMDENEAPADHICDVCAQGNSKLKPTDPYLCGISPVAMQGTCLWRRALKACLEFKRVVAPQLARRLGIENTVAQGLINRLEKEGFISNSKRGKKLGKIVDQGKIESEGVPRYLKTSVTLSKVEKVVTADVHMNMQAATNGESRTKESTDNKAVDILMEKTNEINIRGRKNSARNLPALVDISASSSLNETKGRKVRKRAYSRTDNNEFEITDSQELQSTKKKASTVSRDIAV